MRLQLDKETIELTEFLAPRGRPMPDDVRPNDRVFQHIAIIVRDVDEAYARLRLFDIEHASSGPQRLPDWNPNAGGIRAFYFRDPDRHFLEILAFHGCRARTAGSGLGGRTLWLIGRRTGAGRHGKQRSQHKNCKYLHEFLLETVHRKAEVRWT